MSAQPKIRAMQDSDGNRIDGGVNDIVECALRNDFQGVDRILATHPDFINAQRSANGITALMGACGRGLERMVVHLLSKNGIDLNVRDDFGKNAFEHGRLFPPIVALLVRHAHPQLHWKEPPIFTVP